MIVEVRVMDNFVVIGTCFDIDPYFIQPTCEASRTVGLGSVSHKNAWSNTYFPGRRNSTHN